MPASSKPGATDVPPSGARPFPATSSHKRATARSIPSGSQPRSNRTDASVLRPSRFEVQAIAMGAKYAASRSTRVVASDISDEAPPMIPPMPTGTPVASQMRQSATGSESEPPTRRSMPSRVTTTSAGRAARTRRPAPGNRSRS